MYVGNLISGPSAFSKTSLNIRKFTVHVLLKPAWRILSITLLACEMSAFVLPRQHGGKKKKKKIRSAGDARDSNLIFLGLEDFLK